MGSGAFLITFLALKKLFAVEIRGQPKSPIIFQENKLASPWYSATPSGPKDAAIDNKAFPKYRQHFIPKHHFANCFDITKTELNAIHDQAMEPDTNYLCL
jgi:hypothetical protein